MQEIDSKYIQWKCWDYS